METVASDDWGFGLPIGEQVPRRGNRVTRGLGRGVLRAMGWRIQGAIPDLPKMVVIGAPHTSNLDAVIGLAALTALGIRASVMGKHTLFRGPLGVALRWLGVIPIDRSSPHGVVDRSVAAFDASDTLLLLIAPEGTRKAAAAWKRGFWAIASGAHVPILPAALDYRGKRIVLGAPLAPCGDYDMDMRRLLAFYRDCGKPRRPDRASGPIRSVLGLESPPDAT